jgi:hypothetical protein
MPPKHRGGLRGIVMRASTRRQTLAALIVSVVAGARSTPAASKRRRRKRCKGGKRRCGKRCVRGTCCPGRACGSAEPNCRCGRTVEGRAFCQTGGVVKVAPCQASADCESGHACIPDGDLSFCTPPCGAQP